MRGNPIGAMTAAVQFNARAEGRVRRGMLLKAYRHDCETAAIARKNGMQKKSDEIMEAAYERTVRELMKRHGIARVLKKATLLLRVLQHAERTPRQPSLFREECR